MSLASFFDSARIGTAHRPGEELPCYGYTHCRQLAAVLEDREEAGRRLNEILMPAEAVILLPVDRRDFWQQVQLRKLAVWEPLLHPAIAGTGYRHNRPQAVVYLKPRALQLIQDSLDESEAEQNDRAYLNAVDFFETKIAPVQLGETTPYFLTPL